MLVICCIEDKGILLPEIKNILEFEVEDQFVVMWSKSITKRSNNDNTVLNYTD